MNKSYYVYILTNHNRKLLYIGMTDDLVRRYEEHKKRQFIGFTSKYNIDVLVYYEEIPVLEDALAREQQIKKWGREKKNFLVATINPMWESLSVLSTKKQNVIDMLKYSAPSDNDPSAALGIKQ